MSSHILIQDLHFAYPGGNSLWEGLNLELPPGSKTGIYGPNGAGKTTLFNLIMGLIHPQAGRIYLNQNLCQNERQFAQQRTTIGYAMQNPDDQIFCATVYDELAFGPLNQGYKPAQARDIVRRTLALFHLSDYEQSTTYRLSGGEKKFLSLATAWALQPQALLLDEPTLSLDDKWLHLLRQILRQTDLACFIISHDYDFLTATCRQILKVENKRLTLLHNHVSHETLTYNQ